ncbi:MAG TPA: AtpZ/AtpI family protein [Puia sp.]|nr:AtpZ/AtpI family protein [Puia sp.]
MAKDDFRRDVGTDERRKLHARKVKGHNPLTGFAVFGLIGWSVAVPTLVGVAAGLALDRGHTGGRSWTLTLLVAGLVLGCWNAWYWVRKEGDKINKENK